MMHSAERTASASIALLSGSPDERVSAARTIKNSVVGNPTNKRLYLRLGVLPPLLEAASEVRGHPELAEQAVAALGSLSAFVEPDDLVLVTPVLLTAIFSPYICVVIAAARALKMLVTAEGADAASLGPLIAIPEVAGRLVSLLGGPDEGVSEICALILARSSVGSSQAKVLRSAGALTALVSLLCRTSHEKCIEACLNAMSALARQDCEIARDMANPYNIFVLVLPYTRGSIHSLRLSACRLLMIFHSVTQLPSGLDGVVTTALVDLLNTDDAYSQIATAHTLAELVLGCEVLQRMASEAGAIKKLAEVIKSVVNVNEKDMDTDTSFSRAQTDTVKDEKSLPRSPEDRAALQAAALTALAALSSELDDVREDVVSLQVLPCVIASLMSKYAEVALASVKCIRSLSRSVKVLRRDIANEDIGPVLLNLLATANSEIRRIASATLCNLMIEFSPIRHAILDRGLTLLFDLLHSEDDELRKNSLWAIKNLLFKADADTKNCVLVKLGYDTLHLLCTDLHPEVRELAMAVLRNLAHSDLLGSRTKQLNALFAAAGSRLVALLSKALQEDVENSEFAVQALYVVCNIASGTEKHKTYLMESDLPQLILRWTSHENEKARIAAVWCAVNLSWRQKPAVQRRPPRLMKRLHRPERIPYNHSRLEMLRRQHLPLPLSPLAGRELAGIYSTDLSPSTTTRENTARLSSLEAEPVQVIDGRNYSQVDSGDTSALQDEGPTTKSSGYEWRIRRLRALGFESRLRSLSSDDPHVEVQGRARTALEMFDSNVHPMDCDPSALLDCNPSVIVRQLPHSHSVLRVAESDSSSAGSS